MGGGARFLSTIQFAEDLENLDQRTLALADPKSSLQEVAQARGLALPEYRKVRVSGPDHRRLWVFDVIWDGEEVARGEGVSKTRGAASGSAPRARPPGARPRRMDACQLASRRSSFNAIAESATADDVWFWREGFVKRARAKIVTSWHVRYRALARRSHRGWAANPKFEILNPKLNGSGQGYDIPMSDPHPLLERAKDAPEKPGIYRFQDRTGKDIYVGKARDLRRRVLSYFGRHDLPERTQNMLKRARGLDFAVTASEAEAFILENTLIKRLRPRFNVLLRDDKTYPYLKLTTGEAWPRVELTRRVSDDGHSYFGPFMGQRMARRLMDLSRTHFQVRTCQIEIDGRLARPCLYYHMRACLGPCVDGLTTPDDYADVVEELRLFLAGRHRQLLPRLEKTMWTASEREDFELAARYRDLIAVVKRLGEKQDVERPGHGDADVVAVWTDGEHATVCLLPYRAGRLVDKREFHFEGVGDVAATRIAAELPCPILRGEPVDSEEIGIGARARRGRPGDAAGVSSPHRGSCG